MTPPSISKFFSYPLMPYHSLFAGHHDTRRGYAMRQELTENGIIWRRPEYVPSWNPKKSGDLKTRTPPDLTKLRMDILPAASIVNE